MNTRVSLALSVSVFLSFTPSAFAQWITNGVPLCTAVNTQSSPGIVANGSGGALIAWQDDRNGSFDIYVQRVGTSGIPAWTANGIPLSAAANNQQDVAVVPDGSGGAIVAWVDHRDNATNGSDVYCGRMGSNGIPQWSANGVALCTAPMAQTSVVIASDGAYGAIVVWRDFRNGNDFDVYAQRVNAFGIVQWTANGVAIATENEDQTIPHVISDGAGGAFIAWFDRRSSPDADAYAQRVSGAGTPLWVDDGISLASQPGIQRNPFLVPDGAGGMIAAWHDSRSGSFDIYSQRVSSTGVAQWTTHGVPVSTAANDQQSPFAMADGSGGVFIAWYDLRDGVDSDLYAQRLNSAGTSQWTANGREVCGAAGGQFDAALTTDCAGGAILAWTDARTGANEYDVYAQRVSGAGAPAWTADGVVLSGAAFEQRAVQVTSDGAGGAIVTWVDRRGDDEDIYATRVLPNGSVDVPTSVGARPASLRASEVYPNPFAATAWIELETASPVPVTIEMFDVAGCRVRSTEFVGNVASSQRIELEARDDAGRLLPSGVYFCRVKAAGETITRKMVIAR